MDHPNHHISTPPMPLKSMIHTNPHGHHVVQMIMQPFIGTTSLQHQWSGPAHQNKSFNTVSEGVGWVSVGSSPATGVTSHHQDDLTCLIGIWVLDIPPSHHSA